MTKRAQPGRLRRELRFSSRSVDKNLAELGLTREEIKPLLQAMMTNDGLLGLYGSELLLLEKILGLKTGELAVSLVGELISVKTVPAGTSISYGYLSTTEETTNLGLVGIGFSDGIPRSATNRFSVAIEGQLFESIGRIAMDQCVVDLGSQDFEPGAEVTLFGTNNSLESLSKSSRFTELELLGRITDRVTRVWV